MRPQGCRRLLKPTEFCGNFAFRIRRTPTTDRPGVGITHGLTNPNRGVRNALATLSTAGARRRSITLHGVVVILESVGIHKLHMTCMSHHRSKATVVTQTPNSERGRPRRLQTERHGRKQADGPECSGLHRQPTDWRVGEIALGIDVEVVMLDFPQPAAGFRQE
jgi:hypothetical protein